MLRKLFQNHPTEYIEHFKKEIINSNLRMVYYVLTILLPVSIFMLTMSIAIQDSKNIIIANGILTAVSVILFIGYKIIKRVEIKNVKRLSSFVIYMFYGIILIWGIHMTGYNSDRTIFVVDMVLSIFMLAFLFMLKYQVLGLYYCISLIYLYLLTPYSDGILNDLPKLMSPILITVSAFFLSRMLYLQNIERFVMSEKLKESHNGLTYELYEALEKLRNTERSISDDIIRTLVKVLEYYDIYTRGHSENVAKYATSIAKIMNLSIEQMNELEVCGLVHDIGKILIPVDLLNKKEALTTEEYDVIKKHSQYGYDMLMEAKNLQHIAKIILHHHERWDAMTSERIYKKAKSFEQAKMELLALKGKQFAPNIVDALLLSLSNH